jgi:putative effector of murein hydrolase
MLSYYPSGRVREEAVEIYRVTVTVSLYSQSHCIQKNIFVVVVGSCSTAVSFFSTNWFLLGHFF